MTETKTPESGFVLLMFALMITAVLGLVLYQSSQNNDNLRRELDESEATERHRGAAQNLMSTLRALIDEEIVIVEPGPKFRQGSKPLPQGWTITSDHILVEVCDFGSFKPAAADAAFRDRPGSIPACAGKELTYRLDARSALPPDTLVVKTSISKSAKGTASWSTHARITASGCLLGLPTKTVKFDANFPAISPFPSCIIVAADAFVGGFKKHDISLASSIPTGATLCSLTLRSRSPTPIYYDDELLLHMSDALLMTTNKYLATYLKVVPGFEVREYKWGHLFLRPFITVHTVSYCAGDPNIFDFTKSSPGCKIPPTETTGVVDLRFDNRALRNAAEWISSRKKPYGLTLVAMGDNNPGSDCRTSPIDLVGEATFVSN